MEFRNIQLVDREIFDEFLNSSCEINKNYCASELNFINLFCWDYNGDEQICVTDTAIFIKIIDGDGKLYFFPPLVKHCEDFHAALLQIKEHCKAYELPLNIVCLTDEMLPFVGSEFRWQYNRNHSEYLYFPEDLIELKGKKYSPKRNHLNYFFANYDYEFYPYTSNHRDEVGQVLKKWEGENNGGSHYEHSALLKALENFDALGLYGGILKANGAVIAFSIAFKTHNNCMIVMFEKADYKVRGSYAAINNLFAKEYCSNVKYINRQEDLGIEGLRRAKQSYNPVRLVDKYDLILAQ